MIRLTQKDDQGNWCLRGMAWEQLHVGQAITQKVWERLYGALWKLMEYEDTGLSPEQVENLQDEQRKHRWIPVAERLPETNRTVLIFAESTTIQGGTITLAGACHNGYWFVQNGQDTLGFPCSKYNVVAWMPLPELYRPETPQEAEENYYNQVRKEMEDAGVVESDIVAAISIIKKLRNENNNLEVKENG